jgi:hypothetical protein
MGGKATNLDSRVNHILGAKDLPLGSCCKGGSAKNTRHLTTVTPRSNVIGSDLFLSVVHFRQRDR